jgi:uroporphyrinogen III methyltransferase/synthase
MTRRGAEALARADVVVYDGLLDPQLLALAPQAELIYGGKKRSDRGPRMSQEQINQLLIERANAGQRVVRLKGGDPFVFGRGAEEALALRRAGIAFHIVPGVSAATAVSAYAGIPLTARGIASTAALVTGHEMEGKERPVQWTQVALADTVVLFMAWRRLQECVDGLIAAGRPADDPACAIYWGTTAEQRSVQAKLSELPACVTEKGLRPPTLVVVGKVVQQRDELSWYESRPLFGKRILVARSAERASSVTDEIAALGGQSIAVPLTHTVPLTGHERERLARALASLASYDWCIFTSANAVHQCFAVLDELELDARAAGGCQLAAVGPATAQALRDHGLRADCVARRRDGEGIAQALIDAGLEEGMTVFFPRAKEGSDAAVRRLEAAGARVDLVPAYRTESIDKADPQLSVIASRFDRGQIHAAAFFAPSQVKALCETLPDAVERLRSCAVLAAIGKTTAAALEELGLRVHVIPERPDPREMVRGIAEALRS